jgi:plastocyanin
VAVSKQRRRTRILAPALAGLALVASACGGGGDKEAAAPAGADGGQTVALKLIAFKPERLSVPAGTTVTWKNEDASEHTVTSGTVNQSTGGVTTSVDNKFESGSLKQNAAFTFTFTAPGTYSYFCKIHPATMRGEITVN